MNEPQDLETIAFTIISSSGQARSQAFEALQLAKKKDVKGSKKKMEQARNQLKNAQRAQSQLLFDEINDQPVPLNLLQVHAQDHLMNTLFSIDLIAEMIELVLKEEK